MSQTIGSTDSSVVRFDWVVYVSGDTPLADYKPERSTGIGEQLTEEISELNRQIHSITEPPPLDGPAYLFFKAASGHWILTRLTRTNQSSRPAVMYVSVVLTDSEFSKIRRNPWAAVDDGAFELIDSSYRTESRPLDLTPRRDGAHRLAPHTAGAGTGTLLTQIRQNKYAGKYPWAPSVLQVMRALSTELAESAVPTFATWWPPSVATQPTRFRLTFQQEKLEQVSVLDEAKQLAIDLSVAAAKLQNISKEVKLELNTAKKSAGDCYKTFHMAQVQVNDQPIENWNTARKAAAEAALDVVNQIGIIRELNPLASNELSGLETRFTNLNQRLLQERPPRVTLGEARELTGTGTNSELLKGIDLTEPRSRRRSIKLPIWLAGGLASFGIGLAIVNGWTLVHKHWTGDDNGSPYVHHGGNNPTPKHQGGENKPTTHHVRQIKPSVHHVGENQPQAHSVGQNKTPTHHGVGNQPAKHRVGNQPSTHHGGENQPRKRHIGENQPPKHHDHQEGAKTPGEEAGPGSSTYTKGPNLTHLRLH